MLTRIVESNPPSLVELDLSNLGTSIEQGESLLCMLINSEIGTLKKLDLSRNPTWMQGSVSSFTETMARLIARQKEGLELLNLSYTDMVGGVVAVLIPEIRCSASIRTLKTIKLKGVDWDEPKAQQELAHLVAEAPSLRTCDISWKKGQNVMYLERSRKVGQCDDSEPIEQGSVEVLDKDCQVVFETMTLID